MKLVTQLFLAFVALCIFSLVIPPIWDNAASNCSQVGWMCWGYLAAIALTGAVVTGILALYLVLPAKFAVPATKPAQSTVTAWPYGGTLPVMVWLLLIMVVYVYLFIKVIVPDTIDENQVFWLQVLDSKVVVEASVAFLAAGIGSTGATMFAYLRHACTDADWKPHYFPWYILRPFLGSLLGVVFFWLVRGGILAVLPAQDGREYLDLDLNGLAGLCALVGMFSRRAMIKLRETFKVIFVTREERDEEELAAATPKPPVQDS